MAALLATVFAATAFLTIAASSVAHIRGQIISIDRKRGTFLIRHDPFALMPMRMTMEAKPQPAQLRKLHVGETIDATVDTAIDPWPATDIRRAPAAREGRRS